MLSRAYQYLLGLLAMGLAMFSPLALAVIDTSDIETDIVANQAVGIAFGIVILTFLYALRAISWFRKI